MPLIPPLSAPDEIVDPAVERSAEAELQTRREEFTLGISRYLFGFCLVVSVTLGGLWLLERAYPQIAIYAALVLLLALASGAYPALQRRQHTTAGQFIVYGAALLVVLCGPLLIPSLMPAIGIMNVSTMMVAIMLLGDRGSRWLVGAFALAFLADVVVVALLRESLFPPLGQGTAFWVTGVVSLSVIMTAILIIRVIVLGMEQQFRRAHQLNLALEQQIQRENDARETLKRERNLLRTLIDTVPANVYIKDRQSRFVDANLETALQMGAGSASALIGKTDFDFFSTELAEKYFADEQAIFRSGLPVRNIEESNFDQRTQQSSRFLTTKVPILNEQGEVTGLVGVGLDITERTRAQEQIASERDLLRTLIDHIPDYIYIKDAEGRFVNSNAAHNQIAQVKDASELSGKTAFDVFPQHLAVQFDADDQKVLQTGQALINVERISVDRQGKERAVLTTKVPLRDAAGNVTGLAGISRDISDYRRAQEALKQQQAFLRQVIDSIPDLLFVKDWDGNTILVNKAFAELYGTTVEALIEQGKGQLVSPQDEAEHFTRDDHEVMTTLKPKYIPEETLTDLTTGRTRYLRTIKVPLIALDGQARSVLGVSIDITERKRAEAQALALAAEQQRVKLLSEFISDVSHDFRTPLSIIGTNAYLVGKTTDPAKLTQCSQRLEEQISRLTLLLDNFVELVHLEQEASSLHFQPTDLDQLVNTIAERCRQEAADKSQRLEYRCEMPAPLVLGDPTALTHAIGHVVANAIHFTPAQGAITLRLYSEGASAVLEVADTGIGIQPDSLPHIFESFYRVDTARSTTSGGAGLGLSIAKKIVGLMNGRIEVQSEYGSGSVFRIYLPVDQ